MPESQIRKDALLFLIGYGKSQKILDSIIYINTTQESLKTSMQLKPDTFVWGLMDKKFTARLLHAQRGGNSALPTMEEQMVNMMELAEMAKLAALITENIWSV